MEQTRTLVEKAVAEDLVGDLLQSPPPPCPPGYELIRPLGRGGAGEVFLARDTRLDRQVAIKFLSNAGAADLERFRREARVTARLNDPAIVQVYELGEAEGQPYIAMQFVDGGNFADAELDVPRIAGAARDVAVALRHAHGEGIVHRDIKPENILLDGQGRVYLTDFGIARSLDGALGETMSSDGQIMGTPGLMPPEQARGDVQAVDARSDLYALGGTLFVKLTGRYPFEGRTVVDVLHAIIHDEPPLPRTFNAALPRALEAIIIRCLRKSRDDRYQSAEEVIEDLDRFLAGTPVGSESSAWFRQLVGRVTGAASPPDADDRQLDPYWSAGLEVVRQIASWDADLYRVSGSLTRSFQRLDSIRTRLDEILAERPEVAWARFYRGLALFRRGRLHEALEDMERSIDRVSNLAGAYFELGRLYLALYLREHRVARGHVTRLGVEHGLESARSRLEQAVVALAEARRLQGELPPWFSEYARAVTRLAESDFASCVAVCDAALETDPDVEEVWKLRGDALRLAGERPFDCYEKALSIRRTHFEALYAMAEAHLEREEIAEAREALRRARRIHPQFAAAAALLARTYLIEGRRAGNAAAFDHGLELATEAARMDPGSYDAAVTIAEMRLERARVTGRRQELDEALRTLEGAQALDGCLNRVNLLTARVTLERARMSEGPEADRDLQRVLEMCQGEQARTEDNEPWVEIREAALSAVSRRNRG